LQKPRFATERGASVFVSPGPPLYRKTRPEGYAVKKQPDILEILGIADSQEEKRLDSIAERIANKISQGRAKQFADAASELRDALSSAKALLKQVKENQSKIISKFQSQR